MKRHLLVKARRPVLAGRAAHTASALPVRACFAHGYRHRLPVRGSAVPGCFARHCLPPTAFVKRIRDKVQIGTIAEATARPPIFRPQAMLLSQLTILYPRKDCAKFARNSRNGHKLAGHGHGTPAFAYIPRTGPVRVLSVAFTPPHTFSVHVQSVSAIHPQSVRSVFGNCPRFVQRLPRLPRERRVCCSSNRELPNDGSALARNRVDRALGCGSLPASSLLLWVCRAFLLAIRVVVLVGSGGRV